MSHAAVFIACQIPDKSGLPSGVRGMPAGPCARAAPFDGVSADPWTNINSVASNQRVGLRVLLTEELLLEGPRVRLPPSPGSGRFTTRPASTGKRFATGEPPRRTRKTDR